LKVFGEFFSRARFEKSFIATFIALIPKKGETVDIRDFRLISVLGSVYKSLPIIIKET